MSRDSHTQKEARSWLRRQQGPLCSPSWLRAKIFEWGESSDFTKIEPDSGAKIPEKESFRREIGLELMFVEHGLGTRKKTVHVCFSQAIFWSLWTTKSHAVPDCQPRVWHYTATQGSTYSKGRPEAEENPNTQ